MESRKDSRMESRHIQEKAEGEFVAYAERKKEDKT